MCLVLVNSLDVPFYYFSSRIYLFVAKVLLARLPRLPQCCVLHACLLLLCLLLLVVHLAPPSGTLCNQSFPASGLYHYRQSVEYSRANNNPCSCVLPYPRPHHSVSQLSSFLGMITFFHKYGEDMATVLHPLYMLKQSSQWYWGKREQQAYDKALLLLSTTVLVPYSLDRPLRITADASPVGAGAVLAHVTSDDKEEPVAFASKMFSQAELNYPVHEREAAALIFGIKKFSKYLVAREFQIVTDNKPLEAIFKEKSQVRPMSAARLQRWGLLLSAHRYKIVHRRSAQIPHADFLSRFPSADSQPVEAEVFLVNTVEAGPLSAQQVAKETLADPILRKVLCYIKDGWPDVVEEELKCYQKKFLELTAESNCILWNSRVVVPAKMQLEVLEILHDTHPGGSRMKNLARSYVYWPKIDQQIEDYVKKCEVCQSLQQATPHESYVPWSWPTRRWQRISMDFGTFEKQHLLIIQDAHSKWPEVKIVPDTEATTVIEVLRTLFASFGIPEEILSDNGQPFSSKEMAQFLAKNGVVQTFSPTYHPQSDGATENEVKNVKVAVRKQLLDKKTVGRTLQHKVDAWLFTYRNTPHTVTGVSPSELFLGRRVRTPLSMLQPSNILKLKMKEAQEKKKAEQRAKISVYQPGDLVWVRNQSHKKIKWVKGIVECTISSVSYNVQANSRVRQVSVSHLRKRSPEAATIEADPLAIEKMDAESEQPDPSSVQSAGNPQVSLPEPLPLPVIPGQPEPVVVPLPVTTQAPTPSLREGIQPEVGQQTPQRNSTPRGSPAVLSRTPAASSRTSESGSSSSTATPIKPKVSSWGRVIKMPKKYDE